MLTTIKRYLVGKPLENEALSDEKYSVGLGLPILSSDAISSVAYATEEILLVLVPALGALAFKPLLGIALAIIGLLFLLVFSYRQTIEHYPNGGGAYIVAKDNLGIGAGVTAGAALSVDYILTVAVSISAGTAAISSALPVLAQHKVLIALLLLLLITLGNLRGISESAKIFSIPPYAFILGLVCMIVVGVYRYMTGDVAVINQVQLMQNDYQGLYILLLFKAFSSGCSALTGVEAVSNAVPNFRTPATKNAKRTLGLLAVIVFVLFGGISVLTYLYQVTPVDGKTVLSVIASSVFGNGLMFYYIQFTTAIILVMAANTAYSGFPLLLNVISQDGFVPRQFSFRGDRLSYSNGIIALAGVAGVLIVIFKGDTHHLIPLYSVGVFISFTLSQFGMFRRWIKTKEKGYQYKCLINGLGALVTAITVVIVATTKFTHGAWVVVVIIPILVACMLKIKAHYLSVARQLRLTQTQIEEIDLNVKKYNNRVIVPIASVNVASVRALKYAKTIASDNIVAFHVCIDECEISKIEEKWTLLGTDIPLVIKYSPYRKITEPLLEFIDSTQFNYQKGDIVTVILPHFSVSTWWHVFLHNKTRLFIGNSLLKYKHIVIANIPLKLED